MKLLRSSVTTVPGVNEIIVLEKSAVSPMSSWRSLGGELAERNFDTALLFPNSVHAALVASRAAIPERWGYRTNWRGTLLTRAIGDDVVRKFDPIQIWCTAAHSFASASPANV